MQASDLPISRTQCNVRKHDVVLALFDTIAYLVNLPEYKTDKESTVQQKLCFFGFMTVYFFSCTSPSPFSPSDVVLI